MVVLLARQRSGTNMLRGVLGGHAGIHPLPEVFHDRYVNRAMLPEGGCYFQEYLESEMSRERPLGLPARRTYIVEKYLRELEERIRDTGKIGILDVKYNSLHHADGTWRHPSEPPHMLRLFSCLGYPVVHLVRRNHLAAALSLLRAYTTGVFKIPIPGEVERVRYTVQPRGLMVEMTRFKKEQALVRQWLDESRASVLEMAYEDFFIDGPDSGFSPDPWKRLVSFAGLDFGSLQLVPQTRKISPDNIREEIENFDEIESVVLGTEFEPFLNALLDR